MRWIRSGAALLALAAVCLVLFRNQFAHATLWTQSAPSPQTSAPTADTSGEAPQKQFVVLLDPAHGGSDIGARFSDQLLEKDVTLALSQRLRTALGARGVATSMTRESDIAASDRNPATQSLPETPSACLSLHATTSGSGAHIFTAFTSPLSETPSDTAPNAAEAAASESLALALRNAFVEAKFPAITGHASLSGLATHGLAFAGSSAKNVLQFTCPAVAIELSALHGLGLPGDTAVNDAAYQQRFVSIVAAAVLVWQQQVWQQESQAGQKSATRSSAQTSGSSSVHPAAEPAP